MKKLLVLALISGTAYGAWNMFGSDGGSSASKATDVAATDRIWIDHLPRTERDTFNVFLTLTDESIGVFQASSRWKGSYELFTFEATGDQMQIVYPQTGDRERVTAKATECNQGGMDYCLELEGSSHGVKRYYSMKGWEIDGADTIDTAHHKLDTIIKR